MQVYLDNSATTRPYDEVIDLMAENMRSNFGNPSSLHSLGFSAEKSLKKARMQLAGLMKVDEHDVYFNSCGSEANNTAIFGAVNARKKEGNKIITSKIEHPCVLEPMKSLERQGYNVVYLDVDEKGLISLSQLENELDENTILISIMAANNEIGTVQPIAEIGRLKTEFNKKRNKRLFFHTDAVQALAKLEIPVNDVDLMTVSAHKIHAPKGVGALYIKEGISVQPFILGGGQEKGFRSGTENMPGIVGFGKAAEIASVNMKSRVANMLELRSFLIEGIKSNIKDIKINGADESNFDFVAGSCLPSILNISFLGTRAEVLLHTLEQSEIYVSTGSACSSHKKQKSHVLTAIGAKDKGIESAIRFSLSEFNTQEQIEFVVEKLTQAVAKMRKLGSFR